MNEKVKKIGIGSISPIISIIGIMISCFNFNNGVSLGDYLFGSTLPHGIISIILCYVSIIIGNKYIQNRYAKLGVLISKIFFILLITGFLITIITAVLSYR